MFRPMLRKDRQISTEEMYRILNENAYGILSTLGDNGYPYGVPISYVLLKDAIYVHGARKGHKFDNIEHCKRVSFTVVGNTKILPDRFSTNFESVIVFGVAEEVFDDEKLAANIALIEKYSPDFLAEGREYIDKAAKAARVFKINMEHISGKMKDEK